MNINFWDIIARIENLLITISIVSITVKLLVPDSVNWYKVLIPVYCYFGLIVFLVILSVFKSKRKTRNKEYGGYSTEREEEFRNT